jgi:hypothetical protein
MLAKMLFLALWRVSMAQTSVARRASAGFAIMMTLVGLHSFWFAGSALFNMCLGLNYRSGGGIDLTVPVYYVTGVCQGVFAIVLATAIVVGLYRRERWAYWILAIFEAIALGLGLLVTIFIAGPRNNEYLYLQVWLSGITSVLSLAILLTLVLSEEARVVMIGSREDYARYFGYGSLPGLARMGEKLEVSKPVRGRLYRGIATLSVLAALHIACFFGTAVLNYNWYVQVKPKNVAQSGPCQVIPIKSTPDNKPTPGNNAAISTTFVASKGGCMASAVVNSPTVVIEGGELAVFYFGCSAFLLLVIAGLLVRGRAAFWLLMIFEVVSLSLAVYGIYFLLMSKGTYLLIEKVIAVAEPCLAVAILGVLLLVPEVRRMLWGRKVQGGAR